MAIKKKARLPIILAILCAAVGSIWFRQKHWLTASDSELVLYGNVDIRQVELAINGSERIAKLIVESGLCTESG